MIFLRVFSKPLLLFDALISYIRSVEITISPNFNYVSYLYPVITILYFYLNILIQKYKTFVYQHHCLIRSNIDDQLSAVFKQSRLLEISAFVGV